MSTSEAKDEMEDLRLLADALVGEWMMAVPGVIELVLAARGVGVLILIDAGD
jgi:hypothetical protein